MKLNSRQFQGAIERNLSGLYWLSSDEPQLIQEHADRFRQVARDNGFSTRERYVVEANFDWSDITNSADSLSLFSDQKFIDIQLKCKPSEKARVALQRLADTADNNTLVLVCSDKIDTKTSNTKWFKQIEANAHWLPIWPLRENEIPAWIRERLASLALTADEDAIHLIAERTEGNLLATAQEVEKLRLLIDGDSVTIKDIEESVAVSSRYNIFDLGDKLLAAQTNEAIRALNGLRGEGNEPSVVLWTIAKDIRLLMGVKKLSQQGQDSDKALMALGVFKMRQALVRKAAQRLTPGRLKRALELCSEADNCIKSSQPDMAWHAIERSALIILGTDAPHLVTLR